MRYFCHVACLALKMGNFDFEKRKKLLVEQFGQQPFGFAQGKIKGKTVEVDAWVADGKTWVEAMKLDKNFVDKAVKFFGSVTWKV